MLRIFISSAVLWICAIVLGLVIDPHLIGRHWFTFLYVTALLVGLPFAWRWLAQYRFTASVAARVDAAEGRLMTKVALLLEGAKSAILMTIASAFATAKDWADSVFHTVFGLTPGDLDPFKDSTLLHAFFTDGVVLKAIAGISFFAALLSIKGKLTAAKIVPATPAAS